MFKADDYRLKIQAMGEVLKEAEYALDIGHLKPRLAELEKEQENPDVWQDLEKSTKIGKEISTIRNKINAYEKGATALSDAQDVVDLIEETEDESLIPELDEMLAAAEKGVPCKILAGRNAHSSFVSAAALLGADVEWLWGDSYLSCLPDAESLEKRFAESDAPTALYITSPDYLGNVADVAALATACHRHGVLLLVDNAHGAYLKFLPESCHPIDLGADAVADSAHKTLPVLTGGGYLHIGKTAPAIFAEEGKRAMALFGSTSPSYLILTSLDLCNLRLQSGFGEELAALLPEIDAAKKRLKREGWDVVGNEPLKITLRPKSRGYLGTDVAEHLTQKGIVAEFFDRDFVVFMLPVADGKRALRCLMEALMAIPEVAPIIELPPAIPRGERRLSLREAMLSPMEKVPIEEARGRVLASAGVLCPPAVPIVQMGEEIGEEAVKALSYYGISHCTVVRRMLRRKSYVDKKSKVC